MGHFLSTKTILLLLVGVSLITINPRINGWNEASRMALTQSLVEQGTLVIDNSEFADTGDKVFINGHYYSDKPPFPSIIGAMIYYPLYHLGLRLDYGWNAAYYLIILFSMKLWWILSVLAFGQIMQLRGIARRQSQQMMFIYAFSSLAFTWSASFNNHSLAASWLTIALLYYFRANRSERDQDWVLSGLFFGLASAADVPTGIFFLGFITLIYNRNRSWASLASFSIAGLMPIFVYLGVNYSISGSLFPLQIVGKFFEYEGSVWGQGLVSNSAWGAIKYGLLSLVGSRGFIWYNPLVLLLIPALILHIIGRGRFHREGVVIGISSIILMLYYFVFTQNFGGWSYSMRWFVPMLPFLYFYLQDAGEFRAKMLGRKGYSAIIVISVIISSVGIINPWSNPNYHSIPLIANMRQLMEFFL